MVNDDDDGGNVPLVLGNRCGMGLIANAPANVPDGKD